MCPMRPMRQSFEGAVRLRDAEPELQRLTQLDERLSARIQALCADGDRYLAIRDFESALTCLRRALDLLPEPYSKWEAATWILAAIGDAFFLMGRFADGRAVLSAATQCPGGVEDAFIRMRLGECCFELGELERAKAELARAYRSGGEKIFGGEELKYLALVRATVGEIAGN